MLVRFLAAMAAALTLAFPAVAQNGKADPAAEMRKFLSENRVQIQADEIDDQPLFEVLNALSRKHRLSFVIMEEEFRKNGLENAKDRKSSREKFELKAMTLDRFLEAWLPGFRATHRVRPDYIEIVPLTAANSGLAADALAELLQKLHSEEFVFEGNVNDVPLFEILLKISAKHKIPFVINEEAFRGTSVNDIRDKKPSLAATPLRGLTPHDFLVKVLNSMGATYLLKGKTVEIVPPSYAARATKSSVVEMEDGTKSLAEPLVSAVIVEKPLTEVVAEIAERFDLTVVISPQSGEAKSALVSARLQNVPADKALDLLAWQLDLRVVRKGPAFLITSRLHEDRLFTEQMDRERQKLKLDRLRKFPPPKPESELMPMTTQLLPAGVLDSTRFGAQPQADQ